MVYWSNQLDKSHYEQRYQTMGQTLSDPNGMVKMPFGLPSDEFVRVCKQRYRMDWAKVTVVIMEPKAMKIVKDVKMSFYDQLGVIGGTMGLFTGASLLSIVEALFWFVKVRGKFP